MKEAILYETPKGTSLRVLQIQEGMTAGEALNYIKEKRPTIHPNKTQKQAPVNFQKKIKK